MNTAQLVAILAYRRAFAGVYDRPDPCERAYKAALATGISEQEMTYIRGDLLAGMHGWPNPFPRPEGKNVGDKVLVGGSNEVHEIIKIYSDGDVIVWNRRSDWQGVYQPEYLVKLGF